jgi:hypothetical protein
MMPNISGLEVSHISYQCGHRIELINDRDHLMLSPVVGCRKDMLLQQCGDQKLEVI